MKLLMRYTPLRGGTSLINSFLSRSGYAVRIHALLVQAIAD